MFKIDFLMDGDLPKPLPKEELFELFSLYQSSLDPMVREEIILYNLRLIVSCLKRYEHTTYDMEELFSVGMFGLIRSVDTFDLKTGNQFSTYAVFCINRAIAVFIRDNLKHTKSDSFNTVVRKDKDGKELTLESFLFDEKADVLENYEEQERRFYLRKLVKELPPKKRKIVELYYGFTPDGSSYKGREIGEMFGVSLSRVSYIIRETVKQFREEFKKLDQEPDKVLKK